MLVRPRSAKGAALVEMVFALPLLVAALVGTADFARIFYYSIELTNAARAGAQYGAYNSARATETANIQAAARSAAPNLALTGSPVAVTVSTVCQCATADGSGQPWTVITCGNLCTGGTHQFETVTVTATQTFTMISRFVPAIPNTLTVSRKATMRVPL